MKKFFIFFLIALFSVFTLLIGISCKTIESTESKVVSETTAGETTAGETTNTEKKVEFTIWAGPQTSDDQNFWLDTIAGFESEHPGVTVKYILTPWDTINAKYTTAFASGDTPDLIYAFTGGYVDDVMPLCYNYKEIFTADEFKLLTTGVADSVLLESTLQDGNIIGVPYWTEGDAFAYNVDLLKEAGFDKAPDTMDQQLEYAKALTKDLNNDGKIDQYGYGILSYDGGEEKPESFLYDFGYYLMNDTLSGIGYDDKGSEAAFKYVDQLWNIDKSAVPIGLYSGTTMIDAFFTNKFAMWEAPMHIIADLRDYPNFNLGIASMPQGPGKNIADGRGVYTGSGFWAIPKNVKDLELAKAWIKYIYNPDVQKKLCEAYGFIPSNSQIEVKMDPLKKTFSESFLKHGIPYRFSPKINEVKQSVWDAMAALQSGDLTPEEAWTQAVDNGKAVFK
jgi:multiple sugar transport system substrate-binding protein